MTTAAIEIPTAPRRAERRGVAMLLVIIALGAATALTSVYLSSRRNSGLIGRNAASSAGAQWASRAAADLAVATMQTDTNWRDLVADGVLFDNIALSGAAVAALVTDLEGNPPDENDPDLVVTGVAAVDGVTATSQRIVSVIPEVDLNGALNPYLDEYTVFVTDSLDVGADSVIAVWPDSQRARLHPPVKIGASATGADTFAFDPSSHLVQGVAYLPHNAGVSLQAAGESEPFVGNWTVPVDVPVLPPSVTEFEGLPDQTGPNGGGNGSGSGNGNGNGKGKGMIPLGGGGLGGVGGPSGGGNPNHVRYSGAIATLTPGAYRDVTVENSAVVTLAAGLDPARYSVEDLEIANNAVLRIVGEVRLQIRNGLRVRNGGAIELADADSRLVIVLHGAMEVDDAGVGVPRAVARNTARTADDITADARAEHIRILTTLAAPDMSDPFAGAGDLRIRIDGRSLVVAAIHAPETPVELDEESTLVGRITAATIVIDDASALFFDPTLDNRAGLTSPRGPLYTRDGDPIDGLEDALASLPPDTTTESLATHVSGFLDATIINTLNITESLVTGLLGDSEGGAEGEEGEAGSPSDPSPRSGALAEPIDWPLSAFALERDAATPDTFSGAFVLVDPLIAEYTLIGSDLITKSTGTEPVTTLDRTAPAIEPTATFSPN